MAEEAANNSAEMPQEAAKQSAGGEANQQESLTQQLLEQTQQEAAEFKDRYLRALADLANLKKRMAQENRDARLSGSVAILNELLPVLDNFERALEALDGAKDLKSMKSGVNMIHNQLQTALKKTGLHPIKALGQPFDPHFHEAAGRVPTNEAKEGSIVNEMQRGYMLGNRVIRPSKVIVATKQEATE